MRINFKRFFPCMLAAALISVSAVGCAKSNSSVQENTTEAVIPDSLITIKDSDTDTDVSDAVEITLNGSSVSCSSSSVAINGSEITISSGGSYVINGTLNDGRIIVDADDAKVHLILNGVSIHSETNAAIYVKSADKTTITLADGTDNTLSDSSNYTYDDTDKEEPDAVLFSKDDLSINGNGSLNIEASFNNGITCKNDLKIISGTINVTSKNNAIKGKDSLSITGGTITASAEGKGLLSNNNEEEDKGYIHITGGTITLTCTDDAIHSNNAIYIEGGDMTLSSSDDGIHADNTLVISDGTIDIAKCYEGLEAAAISIDGGAISITASDDGINAADGSSSSEGGPGMRGGPDMGENSGSNCSLTINDGTVYVNAGGDGIDSNSYIVMTGGALVVDGPTGSGNGGLDYNNYFTVTGGYLVVAGSSGMAQNISDSSTQCGALMAVSGGTAGTPVTVADSDGNVIISFTPAKSYNALNISTPDMKTGMTYTIYQNGTLTGSTQIVKDCYTGGTIEGGTELTTFEQSSTVTNSGISGNGGMGGQRPGGGNFGGGQKPDDNNFGGGQKHDDSSFDGGQKPDASDFGGGIRPDDTNNISGGSSFDGGSGL